MSTQTIRGEVWEGSDFDIRALVTDKDGYALTNAVSNSYSAKIYDMSSGNQEVHSIPVATPLAGILFDVPITTGWSVNATGYNFSLTVEPDLWAVPQKGGHTYKIEVLIDTQELAGQVAVVAIVSVQPLGSV